MTYKYSLSQIPLFFLLQLSSVWDNNGWGDTKKCFSRWGAADFFLKSQKGDRTEQRCLFLFEEKKCLTGFLVRRCFITCTVKSHCLSKNILIT